MRGQFPLAGETQAGFVEKAASVMSCEGREGFRRAALERGFWEERKCREGASNPDPRGHDSYWKN